VGYNTTIVILNDALDSIKDDPDFGNKVYKAIVNAGIYINPDEKKYRHDLAINGLNNRQVGSVIDVHHADDTAILAVGANCGSHLHYHLGWGHTDQKVRDQIIMEMERDRRARNRKAKQLAAEAKASTKV